MHPGGDLASSDERRGRRTMAALAACAVLASLAAATPAVAQSEVPASPRAPLPPPPTRGSTSRSGATTTYPISTPEQRARAAAWLEQMVATCAAKAFEAVEYDNLDSGTRFDETPMEDRVPFDRDDAIAYAELLADLAHAPGLAAAQ